jgi:hypothetical protein
LSIPSILLGGIAKNTGKLLWEIEIIFGST